MAKGENIFKRKDGRWEARYIKGYELSGKIKYGFCYGKTYREAKEKVTKCKAALVNGKPIPSTNSRHRFSFYCDEWLRISKANPSFPAPSRVKRESAAGSVSLWHYPNRPESSGTRVRPIRATPPPAINCFIPN